MSKILVLTEKPSVAKDLARVLGCRQNGDSYVGQKYIITWALGHLVTLADPEAYDSKYASWNLSDLPMLPQKMQLTVIKQTSKRFKEVAAIMRRPDIDELVIATDAGREGELVARWIMQKAGWRKPAKRLWISSQTDRAIKEGFSSLRPSAQYDNLYLSALARAEADWLVGLNVTRALTCKHNAQLSAGRVQTPTLALIVRREEEIEKFVPRDFFSVYLELDGYSALFQDEKGYTRFSNREEAQRIADSVAGKPAAFTQVQKEYRQTAPPAAYDLTELQRDANRKYAYSAKQTLVIMQCLYETHKLLTYPRTDSRYISDDVVPTLPERLRSIAVEKYAGAAGKLLLSGKLNTKYIVNNAKVTDHHAIIPTEEYVDLNRLSPEEKNIYDLVVRRFMAVLSPPFEYEEVKVRITCGGKSFFAKGRTVLKAGWKELYGLTTDDDDSSSDLKLQQLPKITQGMSAMPKSCSVRAGKTKPPARYTEATLLTAMENPSSQVDDAKLRSVLAATSGLGTPATRADIIEKLFDIFYIERKGKDLYPTSKGKQLIKIVPPDLKSAELTAKWEQQLQDISMGKLRIDRFIEQMREYATSLVSQVIADSSVYVHDNVTMEKCPECGKNLLDVNGKKGRMLICPDRECGYRKSVSVQTNARCPNCHKKLEMRGDGDKKMFFCVCGYREKLSDFEKRREERGAGKRDVQSYMKEQSRNAPKGNTALADQLAKWLENSED